MNKSLRKEENLIRRVDKFHYWKRCSRSRGYLCAGKKGREKGREGKRREGKKETKGSRAPRRFDSRRKGRFRVYAGVCVPRAGSACCIAKGAISNFTQLFISLAPLSTVLSADPLVNPSRGEAVTPPVQWLSRLINRYAILNFPKNYPTILPLSYLISRRLVHLPFPFDFSNFLFLLDVFHFVSLFYFTLLSFFLFFPLQFQEYRLNFIAERN